MTPAEVAAVLTAFRDNWPHHELSESQANLWATMLAEVDAEDGGLAMLDMLDKEKFFPPIARFKEAAANHKRGRLAREAPALPEGRDGVALPSELIGELRATLTAAAERKNRHWHGGPRPCSVCGGMDGLSRPIAEPVGDACERCLTEHKNVPSCPMCGAHHRATRTRVGDRMVWLCCVCSSVYVGTPTEFTESTGIRDAYRAARAKADALYRERYDVAALATEGPERASAGDP
jgi:hypothetical protein